MGQLYTFVTDNIHIGFIYVRDDGSAISLDGGAGDANFYGFAAFSGINNLGINTTSSADGDLVLIKKEWTAEQLASANFASLSKQLISTSDTEWENLLATAESWGNDVTSSAQNLDPDFPVLSQSLAF